METIDTCGACDGFEGPHTCAAMKAYLDGLRTIQKVHELQALCLRRRWSRSELVFLLEQVWNGAEVHVSSVCDEPIKLRAIELVQHSKAYATLHAVSVMLVGADADELHARAMEPR